MADAHDGEPKGVDRRRTRIGNRIDESLARGFANRLLSQAQVKFDLSKLRNLGHFRNKKSRMRAIEKIRNNNGGRFVAAVASGDYYRAEVVILDCQEVNTKRQLCAVAFELDFNEPENKPSFHWIEYPLKALNTNAFITEHATIRLVQRAGVTELDPFLKLMRPFWCWASVAHEVGQNLKRDFHWFCPIPSGLLAVITETNLIKSGHFTVSTARTYIDSTDLRPQSKKTWDRLIGTGALEKLPKFPRLSQATRDQYDCLHVMAQEGADWVRRHEHAASKEGEQDLFSGET